MQVSEEIDEEIIIEGGGDYSVMFDPLDGSSNIDCGVSIGTIYGIFKKPADEAASVKNVLRVCSLLQFPDTTVYEALILAIKRSFW
jgi:fructose-1,6-bisphosphatase I